MDGLATNLDTIGVIVDVTARIAAVTDCIARLIVVFNRGETTTLAVGIDVLVIPMLRPLRSHLLPDFQKHRDLDFVRTTTSEGFIDSDLRPIIGDVVERIDGTHPGQGRQNGSDGVHIPLPYKSEIGGNIQAVELQFERDVFAQEHLLLDPIEIAKLPEVFDVQKRRIEFPEGFGLVRYRHGIECGVVDDRHTSDRDESDSDVFDLDLLYKKLL